MAKQLPKRDLENVGLGVTGACVALVTLVVAALIFMVAQKGLSAFVKDGVSVVEFFTGTKWDLANTAESGLPYTGALPLIVTSFAVMVLSTLIALPIAIGSAIFAVEIRPKFGSKVFQPLIELLTGVPSVVFGLIGFHVVVGLMKSVFHVSTGLGILPGAVVLAVMILPIITSVSRDIFMQTPRLQEEAAIGLGATKWEMIKLAVLPFGKSGIVSASMLGLGRALGETMAVLMILSPGLTYSIKLLRASQNQTIAANIAAQYPEADPNIGVPVLIGTGLVLFVITFLVNFVARKITEKASA